MFELFSNPAFMVAGGALVSAPVIIHLINRMRFRRIRWAAMEFLLKSQKRNRRRLIIEQLILLMLRCLLVLLTAMLVMRFVGLGLAGFSQSVGYHIVMVDDTLSMGDQWKENNDAKNCFAVAKQTVIMERIYNNLAQSTTNERLVIVPLSTLVKDPDHEFKVYENLSDINTKKSLQDDLNKLKETSKLRIDMKHGLAKAQELFKGHPHKRHILHIVGDFRRRDWTGDGSQETYKILREMGSQKVDVRLVDTAHPYRVANQGGAQLSHDNVGIVDFRPNTRIVGKGMPITFTVRVANYSPAEKKLSVRIIDSESGSERLDIDMNPPMPIKVPAGSTKTATFELREFPKIEGKQFHSLKLVAELVNEQKSPLEDDGLLADNIRHASVEIRNKVPILIIDGNGARSLKPDKDAFFITKAIEAVPGGTYELVYGHDIAGAKPEEALERDLSKYPTIFLLNVRELTTRQRDNLEHYVREGGGVGFFLGPQVKGSHYRKDLYRNGEGLFPAPVKSNYYPIKGAAQKPKYTGEPQLLLRHDQFPPTQALPIFGPIFREIKQPKILEDFPVLHYFPVERSSWKKQKDKVFEIATLPNKKSGNNYQQDIRALINSLPIDKRDYKEFRPGLVRYKDALYTMAQPTSEAKAYHVAGAIKRMLNDTGKKGDSRFPDLVKFWNLPDPEIRKLKKMADELYESTQFGDPFIVGQQYGKGRVLAFMSTAGKDWNYFAGGSMAMFVFQPVIWEAQNWLSAQTSESNRLVGEPVNISVDIKRYKEDHPGLTGVSVLRSFYKAGPGRKLEIVRDQQPTVGQPDEKGNVTVKDEVVTFHFKKNLEPGFYLTQLYAEGKESGTPLKEWGHVFNVDTANEGKLQRVSEDELKQAGAEGESKALSILSPQDPNTTIINRQTDFSESAIFFLLFIIILVCEQALAVHLSFHLKQSEGQMPAQVAPQRRAA